MKTKLTSLPLTAACLALLGGMPFNLPAATILVTNNADSGTGSLRQALAGAANGDIIDATGISGAITLTNNQLNIFKSVTILGPGPGGLTVSGNNAHRVFYCDVAATNVTLSGLTVANGYSDLFEGAGISVYGAGSRRVRLANCIVSNNVCGSHGAGVYIDVGVTLTVSNCTICANSTPDYGAGIMNNGGSVVLINSTVSGNSAYCGGGIFNDGYNADAILWIGSCTFSGNSAHTGGGIYNYGFYYGYAALTVTASTFSSNSASYSGGGIHNDGEMNGIVPLTISASTFSGNSATYAGGIYNDGSYSGLATLWINACTFSRNSAATDNAAICNSGYGGTATLNIGDTILSTDAGVGTLTNFNGVIRSYGYNLSSDAGGGCLTNATDQVSRNPLLGPLQNNGGPTRTHALLPGSPAIDRGRRDAITNLLSNTDQRGLPRPFDDPTLANAAGGDGSDIGAFEVQYITVTNRADSGPGSLRAALTAARNGDAIDVTGVPGTITLTSGTLTIPSGVTILGPGASTLTVSGNKTGRVLNALGTNITISGLTIANGAGANWGSGILTGIGGSVLLDNCVVTNNSTTLNGGGIFNSSGATLTISNCTICGNSAPDASAGYGWGGGIVNNGGTLTLNQCTVTANNCAGDGGAGMDVESGTATVNQCTLTGNSATDSSGAGGIALWAGSATVNNSIVAGNTAPTYANIYGPVSLTGNNLTSGSPLLALLGNYGGSTPTMPPLPGSPAIDGCTSGTSFTTDQRGAGFPRVAGAYADIGAVELGNPIPALLVNTAVDENDGLGTNGVSLRDALAYAPSGSTIVFAPALSGSAILLTNGQLNVANSVTILGPGPGALTVSGNHASRVFHITGVNVTISGLTIANGNGDVDGAGVRADGSPGSVLTISGCVVTNNSSLGNFGGGGLFNVPGTVMNITNCTISGNSANRAGGGVYNLCGVLNVERSTLSGNSAPYGGGGFNDGYNTHAALTINGSTFSGNSATGSGGGIYNWGYSSDEATLTINASTFSSNSFAGIISDGPFSIVEIGDTLLSGSYNIYTFSGTVISDGYNLSSDNGGGWLNSTGDQTNTVPLLGPLQDNGGPTFTHALLPGSPAIDKGKANAVAGLARATDQRGLSRPVNVAAISNAAGGDGSDIGAYEFQPRVVTGTNDSGPGSLRDALASASNGDIIDVGGVAGTITLTNGQLEVANSVAVLGPGAATLTVSGNRAGRVFDVTGTNVMISGLTIADGYGASYGTGIKTYGAGTRLTVNNCVITNNSTTLNGGGIFNDPGVTLIVSNSTLCGNSAPGGWGGGICNYQGTLVVANSTLCGNSANLGAGVFNEATYGPAALTIAASTLNNNSANYGGGIYNHGPSVDGASVTILNSTLSANNSHVCIGNDGAWGGNVVLTIMASTFSGNVGTGIYNDGRFGGSATLELGDTIFSSSGANTSIENAEAAGTVISDGFNLSSDNGGGCLTNATTDLVSTDPKLGPLQNNGGPTATHALLSGSPAIDRGKNFGLSTDQRGRPRPVNFAGIPNAMGGDGSDIGAFEAQISPGSGLVLLTGAAKLDSGGFGFSFTNVPGATFTVFTATNVALPLSNWTVLGVPIEIAPGQFQFADPQVTNSPQQFYRVTSP